MDFFTFVLIITAVFGVLQIILFFKIWGMTNDVAEIVTILKENSSGKTSDSANKQTPPSSYSSPLG